MNQDWQVVLDLCPHGGNDVVVAKCRPSGVLVAFCPMCNAAWLTPADLSDINDDFVICCDHAENGIEIPSSAEVSKSPWAAHVIRSLSAADYIPIDEINASLLSERAKRSA